MYQLWFFKYIKRAPRSGMPPAAQIKVDILTLGLVLSLLLACITLGMGSAAAAEAKTFKDCPDCPEMVVIPAGSFTMGSGPDDIGSSVDNGHYDTEIPIHKVNVSTFALGKTHVTLEQFGQFVDETGYSTGRDCYKYQGDNTGNWLITGFPHAANHPVTCMSWNDAHAYIDWLSRKTGKHYRLPSEAEWEYAARAGSTTAFFWGKEVGTGHANCDGCGSQWGGKGTSPVGSFPPNAFGLYDMLGNAWQWVEDKWHPNYVGAPTDGSVWTNGENETDHIVRGGSWDCYPSAAVSADRIRYDPTAHDFFLGFRLAREVP